MKITYSMPVANDITMSHISTRVLTENLINNDRMESHFSDSVMTIGYNVERDFKNISWETVNPVCYYTEKALIKIFLSQKYKEKFLSSIKGDYLLYSMCVGPIDYAILSYCLNNGIRIVLGGSEINMTSNDDIRKNLMTFGAKEKNLKNAIFVKGYVTQKTDLHSIIKKWKNVKLDKDDNIKNIVYAKNDYTRNDTFKSMRKIFNKINPHFLNNVIWPNDIIVFPLNSLCPWNKCRFCRYCEIDNIDLLGDTSEKEIINGIMDICHNLNCYNIFISDAYFSFTDKRIRILKKLNNNGVKFICQTGINSLKNEEYTKKMFEYFDIVCVGMETTTDFGLYALNKGYKWEDIKKAMNNIKKYYNGKSLISINHIIDTPCYDIEDIYLNYKRLIELKEEMKDLNINFTYSSKLLNISTPKIFKSFSDLKLIRKPKEGNLSGRFLLWEELNKTLDVSNFYNLDGLPFERIDKNGNLIDSDINIIEKEIFKKLMDGWKK
jgi:hypothetical protein